MSCRYAGAIHAYGLGVDKGPPAATASISFCTAGAGISSNCAFGFFTCSKKASCCAFHESGAGCPVCDGVEGGTPRRPQRGEILRRSCNFLHQERALHERLKYRVVVAPSHELCAEPRLRCRI